MEKQFVPYELAVKLKELGFDEPCFYYYEANRKLETNGISSIYYAKYIKKGTNACVAPLWQQAFDWFREKYRYSSIIPFNGSEHYYWWITECNPFGLDINSIDTHDFTTYEEARQACLEKLIELITKKD